MSSKADTKTINFDIDAALVEKTLAGFLADVFKKTGAKKAIIGLSGGLDSTVSASLCVRALGAKKVLGVIMPYKTSASASRNDAEYIASELKIATEVIDITPMVDSYFFGNDTAAPERMANMMARQRMTVLYDISAREQGLVVGTSNKSEIMLGYGTIFGDMASAVNPVGDLYKSQERQLAKYIGIPDRILDKVPSADLIEGQTDEGDLGFSYEEVDPLLYMMIDERSDKSELLALGFKEEIINEVARRVRQNHFKRIPPLIAKISKRTVGHEFRYAWDWSTVS